MAERRARIDKLTVRVRGGGAHGASPALLRQAVTRALARRPELAAGADQVAAVVAAALRARGDGKATR